MVFMLKRLAPHQQRAFCMVPFKLGAESADAVSHCTEQDQNDALNNVSHFPGTLKPYFLLSD